MSRPSVGELRASGISHPLEARVSVSGAIQVGALKEVAARTHAAFDLAPPLARFVRGLLECGARRIE
ncbi:hypothetical protein [Trinickia sp. EG282A]|uniref:hypothetical protein n=1 Tax=Trinickia sp. EG282A TaxID=3237013 RepID=UPI0034D1893C